MPHDAEAVRSLIVRYFRAFAESRDAEEISRCFAQDGDLMGVDGTYIQGREAIRAHYEVELAGDLGSLRVGEPRLTAFRDLGSASFADARWELWGPDSDESMATPAGSFLVGSDEDGQATLLAARVMVPVNLG